MIREIHERGKYMNNPKIFKKVLVVALALAMVVGAFSMFTFGASAETYTFKANSAAVNALISESGINFDDFAGTVDSTTNLADAASTEAYLRNNAGMMITASTDFALRSGTRIVKKADGDYALSLNGNAFFINANVGDARSDEKYAQNSMLLDLFNNPDGPEKFTLSMGVTVIGQSGTVSGFGGSSDNGGSVLTTKYRGISGVSFNGSWLFKITAANLPAIKETGEVTSGTSTYKTVELADSIPDNMKDKGYIYNSGTISIVATSAEDDIVKAGLASKPSSLEWGNVPGTSSCLSEEHMDMDGTGDALLYTLGEEFEVKFEVTKLSAVQINIDTYIDGVMLGSKKLAINADSGNTSDWKYGIRLFDQSSNVQIDNIKVTSDDFGDIHTGAWADTSYTTTVADLAGQSGGGIIETTVCNRCGEVLEFVVPNVVVDDVDSVSVDGIGEKPSSDITTHYFARIADYWATLKTAPYWINFDMDITALTTSDSGKSLVTWLNKSAGYTQLFRLFANGEIRLKNNSATYTAFPDGMRLQAGTVEDPHSYGAHIKVDPATGRYDVYLIDHEAANPTLEYFGTEYLDALKSGTTMDPEYPQLRFNDSGTAEFTLKNLTFTRNVEASEHVHTDLLATADDKSVIVGYDTVEAAYICYCGERVPQGHVVEMVAKCDSVYYGKGEITGLPTTGEYWIVTDYNLRSQEALAEVQAVETAQVMALGDGYNVELPADAIAPTTYQYVFKVVCGEADTSDVETYIDGVFVGTRTVAKFDKVTLGSTDSTDVRFNYTKVVKVGTDSPLVAVTFNDTTDVTIKPCHHDMANQTLVVNTVGELGCTYVCSKCGELGYSFTSSDYYSEDQWDKTIVDGKFSVNTTAGLHMYNIPDGFYGEGTLPYQLKFTLTLDGYASVSANGGKGMNIVNYHNGSNMWNSFLRQRVGENETIIVSSFLGGTDHVDLVTLAEGDSAEISFLVYPEDGSVDIYVNGQYMLTRTDAGGYKNSASQIRFGDNGATFTFSDFALCRVDEIAHVHSDAWATNEEKSVFMTDNVLEYRYLCYCDEIVKVNDITAVHAETKNVYYGNAIIEGLPTEGDFWVAFDYNARTADALLDAATANLLTLGGFALPVDSEMVAPATYQYAVNVVYTAENTANIYIYINGELVEVQKDVVLENATTLTLGCTDSETTDIRFNYVRVIVIGDTETPVAFTYADGVNASIRPCYHDNTYVFATVPGKSYDAKIKAINKLVKIGECSICGEKTYAEQGDVLDIYANYKLNVAMQLDETGSMVDVARGNRFIGLKREEIMLGADPYWFTFDISAEMSEDQVQTVINKTNGTTSSNGSSILAISYPIIDDGTENAGTWGGEAAKGSNTFSYVQLMRAYGVKDAETGEYRKDAIGINFYQGDSANPKFIMESGKSYNVALYMNPAEDGLSYRAYVDGVLIEERNAGKINALKPDRVDSEKLDEKNAAEERMFTFRFTDGNYGDMHMANVALVKAVEGEAHVHSDAWATDAEKSVKVTNKVLEYVYDCYCGEKVVAGRIDSIIENDIMTLYEGENVRYELPEGEFWIAADYNVRSAEAEEPYGAIGIVGADNVTTKLFAVEADGSMWAGSENIGTVTAPNTYRVAIRYIDAANYEVYIDGKLAYTYAGDEIAGENLILETSDARFNYIKLVTLGETEEPLVPTYRVNEELKPCWHTDVTAAADKAFIVNGGMIDYSYVCSVCGEREYAELTVKLTNPDNDNAYAGRGALITEEMMKSMTISGYKYLYLPDGVISKTGSPYWLTFSITPKSLPTGDPEEDTTAANQRVYKGWGIVTIQPDTTYVSELRVIADGWEEGNATYGEDGYLKKGETDGKAELRLAYPNSTNKFREATLATELEVGKTVRIALYVDPTTTEYDVYVDDVYVGSSAKGNENIFGDDAPQIRFHEGGAGEFTYSDIQIIHARPVHTHLDNWATMAEKSVKVTDKTLEYSYTCYCGEEVVAGQITSVIEDAIMNVYENENRALTVPTEAFWLAADYNVRSDVAPTEAYINVNGTKIDLVELISAEGPATYSVAVSVIDDENYEVFVDGVCVVRNTSTGLLTSATALELCTGDNVRFNNVKLVTIGETATPVVPTYTIDETVRPCYHVSENVGYLENVVRNEDGTLSYSYDCATCGERVYNIPVADSHVEADCGIQDGSFTYANGKFTNYLLPADFVGADAKPYQFEFTLTLNKINSNPATLYKNGQGRNVVNYDGNFSSAIRQFPVSDGNGNYRSDVVELKSRNDPNNLMHLVTMREGDTVTFSFYVTPATASIDIYVDGVYVGTRNDAVMDASDAKIRFGDSDVCEFVASDFKLMRAGKAEHIHSDAWVYASEKSVKVTNKALEYYYDCYCGQENIFKARIDSVITDGIMHVRENHTAEIAVPATGFWFATDFNVRNGEVTDGVYISNGDEVILSVVDGKFNAFGNATGIEAKTLSTTSVVLHVSENGEYIMYVGGESYATGTINVEKLTLTTSDYVRLNNNKLVTLGETDDIVVPTYTVDEIARPCYHLRYNVIGKKFVIDGENLLKSGFCGGCGEVVDETLVNLMVTGKGGIADAYMANGEIKFSGAQTYNATADLIAKGDPYWIEYDLTLNSLPSAGPSSLYNDSKGRNIMNFGANGDTFNYSSPLRQFPIDNGDGTYRTDAIEIRDNSGSTNVIYPEFKIGDTVTVALYVDPSANTAEIYFNGEFATKRSGVMKTNSDGFRFGDGPSAHYTVTNLAIYRQGEGQVIEHTHSHAWLNAEERAAATFTINNGKLAYEYDCYCGRRVTAGISEILADEEIIPVYNCEDVKLALEGAKLPTKAVFVGSVFAEVLPTEGVNTLVSFGETAMIGVDKDGKLYVNGVASDATVTVGEYQDFAIVLADGIFAVYFDGAYIGEVDLGGVAETNITIGSKGMGTFHIDNMVLAILEIDGDLAYTAGSDGHTHKYILPVGKVIFNEAKTTLTVEYNCIVCNRDVFDGIVDDLYDVDDTTAVEAIPAIIGTSAGGNVLIESLENYISDVESYWFSADFVITEKFERNGQSIVTIGETKIVYIDSNGIAHLADRAGTRMETISIGVGFNISINVIAGESSFDAHVYLDGKYCGMLEIPFSEKSQICVGESSNLVMDVTNIKLAQIGNNGQSEIFAYYCTNHTYDASAALIEYVDANTFIITNRCVTCGYKVIEKPVYNRYVGDTMPIYDSQGNIELPLNKSINVEVLNDRYRGYWIVADVNVRDASIGSFDGYVNLIGEKGLSYVLISNTGTLKLGDGTEIGTYFDSVTSCNVAVKYAYQDIDTPTDDIVNVYIDGKFVGSVVVGDITCKYNHISDSYEEFGATGLENVKFSNLKSFYSGESGEFITFKYAEDITQIPCSHIYNDDVRKNVIFGDTIRIVYICDLCGESVTTEFSKNLYEASKNSGFTFDENGVKTITTATILKSTSSILGSAGSRYWLRFTLDVESVNGQAVGENNNNNGSGRNFLNFNSNYTSPLRLFAERDSKTGSFREDYLIIKSDSRSASVQVGKIYEGGTYDIALFVNPAVRTAEIYFDGKYITTRTAATHATGSEIRFLDGAWGTFHISNFQFVGSDEIDHVHTDRYSESLGMVPVLKVTDQTLTHTYICTCGETIVAGIDKVYADEVKDFSGITEATMIPESANAVIDGTPYWISAKVYGNRSDATVYSYNDTPIVEIKNGVYAISGVVTTVPVSGAERSGDFDLVSVNVIPKSDEAVVYINGAFVGICKGISFAEEEPFSILLGGTSALDFKNIKVVTLENGAEGRVNIYGCGDHAFGYRGGINAVVTDDGVDYICRYCKEVVRSVAVGDGALFTKDTINISSDAHFIDDITSSVYNQKLANADGGNFFMTFDITPTDLAAFAAKADGRSLLTYLPKSNGYCQYFRIFKIDDNNAELRCYDNGQYVALKNTPTFKTPTADEIEAGAEYNTYRFVIESDPSTGNYYMYMNGEYIGGGYVKDFGNSSAEKPIRFGDGSVGQWTVKNIKIFNPTDEVINEVPEKGMEAPVIHRHFPDTKVSHSITVKNGNITHEFKCVDCGENYKLTSQENLVDALATSYKNLSKQTTIKLGDALAKGTEPYVVSFDITVNSINLSVLITNGSRSVVSFESNLGNSGQVRLLRANAHPYKGDEGKGYVDANGDNYADNVVDFATHSTDVVATAKVGDTVNFTYIIDPSDDAGSVKFIAYVNGVSTTTRTSLSRPGAGDGMKMRLLQNPNFGNFSFTNFRIVRMGDACKHTGPACDGTALTGACTKCGVTVEVAHKYTATKDKTQLWTKYTCETCQSSYIVFNRPDLVADLTFADTNELMKYLTEKYCPVFSN